MDKNRVLRHILENTAQGVRTGTLSERSEENHAIIEKNVTPCFEKKGSRGSILTPLAVGAIFLLLIN